MVRLNPDKVHSPSRNLLRSSAISRSASLTTVRIQMRYTQTASLTHLQYEKVPVAKFATAGIFYAAYHWNSVSTSSQLTTPYGTIRLISRLSMSRHSTQRKNNNQLQGTVTYCFSLMIMQSRFARIKWLCHCRFVSTQSRLTPPFKAMSPSFNAENTRSTIKPTGCRSLDT